MRKTKIILALLLMTASFGALSSCASYLDIKGVAYQSIRMKENIQGKDRKNADIIVVCDVGINGGIEVTIENNTNRIMTIDKTKSFFTAGNGNSVCYYDPTVNVLVESTATSQISGASVNLGSVARAVGVGGVAGTMLSGVNVGGAEGNTLTTTNATYIVDQPKVSMAPHSRTSMGRIFEMSAFGINQMATLAQNGGQNINEFYTPDNCPIGYTCTIAISYSTDDEKTYDFVETTLYLSSMITSVVKQKGHVNDALRLIYMTKGDLFEEDWYTLCFGGSTEWRNFYRTLQKPNYNGYKCNHKLFYNYK